MTNRQGRQERKGKRFVQVFCPSPVSFGKIGMLPSTQPTLIDFILKKLNTFDILKHC